MQPAASECNNSLMTDKPDEQCRPVEMPKTGDAVDAARGQADDGMQRLVKDRKALVEYLKAGGRSGISTDFGSADALLPPGGKLRPELLAAKPRAQATAHDADGAAPDRSHTVGSDAHRHPPLLFRHLVSDEFASYAQQWLETIPPGQRTALADGGYKIEAVRDAAAYDREHGTSWATEQPQGYPAGSTGENLGAFFDADRKTIVLCEYFTPPNWDHQVATANVLDMAARLRHETGHAYDQLRKFQYENDPNIQKMYYAARNRLSQSPVTTEALKYYLQDDVIDEATGKIVERPGLRETIAELFAIEHGGGADARHRDKSVQEVFKDILHYMRKHGY